METTYKSNSNVRRKIQVRLTEPQFDSLVEVFDLGERHAAGNLPERTRETASRAMDIIIEAWSGEAA